MLKTNSALGKAGEQHGVTKQKKPIDHCAVDPHFESMVWDFVGNGEGDESVRSEVVLWRKVIMQALFDFLSIATTAGSRYNQGVAEKWFRHNQSHFFVVCDLADVSAGRLRHMVTTASISEVALVELRDRVVHGCRRHGMMAIGDL